MKAAFAEKKGEYLHARFFADISTWEAYTVTRKLDPDLMSEEHTHSKGLKYGIELDLLKLLGLCTSCDPVG